MVYQPPSLVGRVPVYEAGGPVSNTGMDIYFCDFQQLVVRNSPETAGIAKRTSSL